jgi:hypothetical protein
MNRAAKLFARPGIHNGQLRGLLGDIVNIAAAGRPAHATFRPIRDMGAGATMTPRVQRTLFAVVGVDTTRAATGRPRVTCTRTCTRPTIPVCAGRKKEGVLVQDEADGDGVSLSNSGPCGFSFSCTANQCSTRPRAAAVIGFWPRLRAWRNDMPASRQTLRLSRLWTRRLSLAAHFAHRIFRRIRSYSKRRGCNCFHFANCPKTCLTGKMIKTPGIAVVSASNISLP